MLQGGSLPNFHKVEIFTLPFGMVPSWEIWKREVVQDGYIRNFKPVISGRFVPDGIAYLLRR